MDGQQATAESVVVLYSLLSALCLSALQRSFPSFVYPSEKHVRVMPSNAEKIQFEDSFIMSELRLDSSLFTLMYSAVQ